MPVRISGENSVAVTLPTDRFVKIIVNGDWIKPLSLRDDLFSLIAVSRSGKSKSFLSVLRASVVNISFEGLRLIRFVLIRMFLKNKNLTIVT